MAWQVGVSAPEPVAGRADDRARREKKVKKGKGKRKEKRRGGRRERKKKEGAGPPGPRLNNISPHKDPNEQASALFNALCI
jgi:hypothetical protein